MVAENVKWNSIRENVFMKNDGKKKKLTISKFGSKTIETEAKSKQSICPQRKNNTARLPSKSMSFLSKKVVLKYMDAHQRLQLVHRCPTTRLIDRKIPLYIHKLSLHSSKISVNNVEYKIEKDPRPLGKIFFETMNRDRFWQFSLDQEAPAAQDDDLTPGDVKIEQIQGDIIPQQVAEVRLKRDDVFTINGTIQEFLGRLPVPSAAMKYLTTKLFGGRPCLNVHNLSVCMDGGVLRLPSLLRLIIRNFRTYPNLSSVLQAMKPLLDDRSFPLKSIELLDNERIPDVGVTGHEEIGTAGMLILGTGCRLTMAQLCALKNKRVVMRANNYYAHDFLWLFVEWTRQVRDFGTYYEFEQTNEIAAREVISIFTPMPVIHQKSSDKIQTFIFPPHDNLETFAIRASFIERDTTWTIGMEVVKWEDFLQYL